MKKLDKNIDAKNELHQLSLDYLIFINKDKIHQLRGIVSHIEDQYQVVLENYEGKFTIDYLKSQYLLIEESILDGITYIKTTPLEERRIRVFILNVKKAIITQKKIKDRLIELDDKIDNDYCSEILDTFDFDLDNNITNYLPNAHALENRIITETGFNNAIASHQKGIEPALRIKQIALKYVYSSEQITRENGDDIAKQYGHNSGEKLYQEFSYYSSAANRKGKPQPCTPTTLKNKIRLLESVIKLVHTNKQSRVVDEITILKKIYDSEYL